ncbi:polyphosphate kinase 2, partial [Enterobacter hormaechei]|nr:polyphosphate kinase 2 [Enterobacter hormaechei]
MTKASVDSLVKPVLKTKEYEKELRRLHVELVKL